MQTLLDLRTLIVAMCQVDGNPYVTDATSLNAVINERLVALSDECLCFDTVNTPLTLVSGTQTYDTRGSATQANQMSRVDQIYVAGPVLRDRTGAPGFYSYSDFFTDFPNWASDSGQPVRAVRLAPSSVLLHPIPDNAYTTFMVGQRRHKLLAADSDTLEVPTKFFRSAARFIWVTLNEPWAGEDSLAKISAVDKEAADGLRLLKNEAQSQRYAGSARRSRSRSHFRLG